MKNILVLGAGLSSSSLIRYLLQQAGQFDWTIRVTDQNIELSKEKINGCDKGVALNFDVTNPDARRAEISKADIVISMLPARFHTEIAKDCIDLKTHLITPSYADKEMLALNQDAKNSGVLLMNEIGVDPGIDHMSAMNIIDKIKENNGKIDGFKSFCGGLIAPQYDDNPWNYKFTWNPRNVVLAGSGTAASFIQQGRYKYIPYYQVFKRTDTINIDGYGEFIGYPNRNSLMYRSIYGLENTPTIYRGTLRRGNFCQAWNIFVELGMTDDNYYMTLPTNTSPRLFLNAFLPYHTSLSIEEKFKQFLRKERIHLYPLFEWIGLFENENNLISDKQTPAQILQQLLEKKWRLGKNDKDMIVMMHEIEYEENKTKHKIVSSMVYIGENQTYTAMSNTVGLPVGICAKLVLQQKINDIGVCLPIQKHIYRPILKELEQYDIQFIEKMY